MEVVLSTHSVPIRLTSERWVHIIENHDDLAGKFHAVLETVAEPDFILDGKAGELLAVKTSGQHALVVVYKEASQTDGFVITAFETTKLEQLTKLRTLIWRKPQSKKL